MHQYKNCNLVMAKYFANELALKKSGSDVERLGTSLYSSKIDLTPHQIQAALFAFKSPLDKGVILADEVGLGKTIEAGIVISQLRYEKDAKTLIVSPASLMKQWESELLEKFGLESFIMDRKQFNSLKKTGKMNPFDSDVPVIICSYQMCSAFREEILSSSIYLVVIDEAHKLRNVHNEKNIISNNIKSALIGKKKILLTATPIQNNLMDLYGLVSLIDDEIFGDKTTFRYNYIKNFSEYEEDLNTRLSMVLHRTLRKQVSHYIKFTNRIPRTLFFEQSSQEKEVYDLIRKLILESNEETYLIPAQQHHLIVLILCKLIGSSTAAVISTLSKMKERLESMKESATIVEFSPIDFDIENEVDFEEGISNQIEQIDVEEINREISLLDIIINKAKAVSVDSKYKALIQALEFSFSHLKSIGAEEKVIIFTESRKTQEYLYESLIKDNYEDIILYNGTNNDEVSQDIYKKWAKNHPIAVQENSKSVNMKAAILEYFRDEARILIATEAGAEGLNLQFCSLVINYDLPWNPQRVEQRIGRCHRFGQQHDVVVINFISSTNAVEQRIYELLSTKFKVFNEILGSSDSIIGKLEDGKNIEQAIVKIYQTCRTTEEIDKAFDDLQLQYQEEIDESMNQTRQEILEYFEEDVQELFKNMLGEAERAISRLEHLLWRLTKCLIEDAVFYEDKKTFVTKDGEEYFLIKDSQKDGIWHNIGSELAKQLIATGLSIPEIKGKLVFDISNYRYNLGKIRELRGKTGFIILSRVEINALEKEEYLVFNGILNDGTRIDADTCKKLFRLTASERYDITIDSDILKTLEHDQSIHIQSILNESQERNNQLISEKINQINAWADDKIESTQLHVEEMRAQRKELQRQSDSAVNLIEKERIESEIMKLSKKIRLSWIKLADEEEEIEILRKKMINDIRKEVQKSSEVIPIFSIMFDVK